MKKAANSMLLALAGAAAGAAATAKMINPERKKMKEYADKHLAIMQLFNQWMITKQEQKSVIEYFHKENIKTIAIYGMSFVGERLYDELKGSDIAVKYGIDRNADKIYSELDIVEPNENLENVDAVVVTAIYYFDEICEMLEQKTNAVILSLEDILYEI